jgi:hypothetical protein
MKKKLLYDSSVQTNGAYVSTNEKPRNLAGLDYLKRAVAETFSFYDAAILK